MTRVKTCGITCEDDADLCLAAGADALGFVVEYPEPTPWTLTRMRARALVDRVRNAAECVAVVGGDADQVVAWVDAVEPHAVQLHGDELPATVAEIATRLHGSGITVVKAVRIPVGDQQGAAHWLARARQFIDAGAARILIDSRTATKPAGTGVAVARALAREFVARLEVPVVLAGGLTSTAVGEVVRSVRPWAVDVISGIEDDRHRKVPVLVRDFVNAVHEVNAAG
jgi:phosphoribosylanthranilate isomerase